MKAPTSRYLEGCTAPKRDENQLHAAVVELVALDNAEIKYSTVQNWYPGDEKARAASTISSPSAAIAGAGARRSSWTQVETGSAITWKYPSCILRGDDTVGEFYSIAITNNYQQADTGTKMIHLGATRARASFPRASLPARRRTPIAAWSACIRKRRECAQSHAVRFAADRLANAARIPCPISKAATRARKLEHEATTSKIADDQLFYCLARGIPQEEAVALIVNGFCREVLQQLPMEFAVEAQKLVGISLEGSVG